MEEFIEEEGKEIMLEIMKKIDKTRKKAEKRGKANKKEDFGLSHRIKKLESKVWSKYSFWSNSKQCCIDSLKVPKHKQL